MPVECCLQEAGWNPYYALLLGRLAAAGTSHTVTLQYCLWDHFRVGARCCCRPPCILTTWHRARTARGAPELLWLPQRLHTCAADALLHTSKCTM